MTKRKARRARPVEPTENQLFEAMLAYDRIKHRYRYSHNRLAPPQMQHVVQVWPEELAGDCEFMGVKGLPPITETVPTHAAVTIHRFVDEKSAQRFVVREIIRETIKVAMRTKP